MSASELGRLRADLETNTPLKDEFVALPAASESWATWAQSKSYDVTAAEASTLEDIYTELGDDELDQAAGGWSGP